MRTLVHCLLAATCLPQLAAAQQAPRVDPPAFRWLTTARSTGFPFGYRHRQSVRLLEVHDSLAGEARTINAIALRRAPDDQHLVPAFGATVTLRLSTAPTSAATIDRAFAGNVGGDMVTVLSQRQLSFPATEGPYSGPAPFAFPVPADTPFAFGGSGPLCIDLTSHSHSNRHATRFALYAEGHTHEGSFGTACGGLDLSTTLTPTTATHTISGAPASAPVMLLVGQRFDQAAGFPLPFDLTTVGAPGCELLLETLLAIRGFADATGQYQLTVPVDTAPPGAFYGIQGLTVQPGLNQLGAVFSQANLLLPNTDRVVGRLWTEDLGASHGLRQPVYGAVVEVR